jgi:hypothetical protein
MDPEIKRKLDEQLASGEQSPEDHDAYNRKLEALHAADAILAQLDEGQGPSESAATPSASEQPALSNGWVSLLLNHGAVNWIATRLAPFLFAVYLISKLGPLLPLQMFFGYIVGAVVGVPTFVIGCYRKSPLASTSWWSAMFGGAVSLGVLSLPIAIYFGYRIIRQPMIVPDIAMQTA